MGERETERERICDGGRWLKREEGKERKERIRRMVGERIRETDKMRGERQRGDNRWKEREDEK
jgi:hypothetical protein